jgi:hypothetical protein
MVVAVGGWHGGITSAAGRCSMSWRSCTSHHHAIAQPNNDLANLSASSQPQTTFRFVQPGETKCVQTSDQIHPNQERNV